MTMNGKNIPNTGTKRERPDALDAGTYPARIVQVISLGLQAQRPYQGEEKPPKIELRVTYELADEFMKDEDGNEDETKPRWISEDFPLNSLDSDLAKSTKRYLAIDPTMEYGGDWSKVVGTPCVLTVTQNPSKKDKDVIYNNVANVSTMRQKDADKLPELQNETKVFDFYEPDMEVFGSLPTWLQDKIKESLDFEGSKLENALKGAGEPTQKPKSEPKPEAEIAKEEETAADDW